MSRGPGRWQRVLLAALREHALVSVRAATMSELQREPTRPEMVAARRAARTLAEAGLCRAIYLGECPSCLEFTSTWSCGACNVGARQALVLTPIAGEGARVGSLLGLRHPPAWISVAPVLNDSEATLIEVER